MIRRVASYDNDIDFTRVWRVGYVITAIVLLTSLGGIGVRGLNLGIDFEGGTAWEVRAPGVSVADARDVVTDAGATSSQVQIIGGDTLRIQADPSDEEQLAEVTAAVAGLAGVEASDVSVSTVGPTWGQEISSKAQQALIYFFIVLAIYITIRLEWKMAIGALLAVVQDIIIVVGFYALFQFEVTPATVIAILTILGYSLYDTIVVYDKIKDNADRPAVVQKHTYTALVSLSLNQVLLRTINTTMTSVMPVGAMLFVGSFLLGATTLREFGIALVVGLLAGAYSSIFLAAPLVAWLKEREPENRNLRKRLEKAQSKAAAGPAPSLATPAAPSAGAESGGGRTDERAGTPPDLSDRIIPPRPRKKGKRR